MKIRLDPRLRAIAGMVRQNSVLADIGSDHAYLPCALVQDGICTLAYACDINEGPLARAADTISKYSLSDKVKPLLSDGLSALFDIYIDDIVIAGMGGELIARIINEAPWTAHEDKHFILQPMTKSEYLREWLYLNGFEIELEVAAAESRFIYPVMQVKYTGQIKQIPLLFAWTGKIWDNRDEQSLEYLRRMHSKAAKIAAARGDEDYIRLTKTLGERLR